MRKKEHGTASEIDGERAERGLSFRWASAGNMKKDLQSSFSLHDNFFNQQNLPEVFFFFFLMDFINNEGSTIKAYLERREIRKPFFPQILKYSRNHQPPIIS